ncbi:extracellular solute-binding protein [Chloroflexi bacterium TSY]|nr:extracellular solute-binding protein [Chloroflexi bacterium TSY]
MNGEKPNSRRLSRRKFLQVAAGTTGFMVFAACVAPAAPVSAPDTQPAAGSGGGLCDAPERPWLQPDYEMEAGPIVRAGFGGSFSEQEFDAVWNPFTEITGVEILEVPHTSDIHEQVRAQQAAGRVEFDIVEGTAAVYQNYSDIWMPLNYDIFPEVTLESMDDRWKQPNAVGYAEVPIVIAWSEEAFPGDDKPDSWSKFWDVENYPGGRSFNGFGPTKTIEAALLADGVPRDQLYPLDFDRAFTKLEEIKPHIAKWWTSGTESQQLLTSGDATVVAMSNSRIENLMDQELPFTYTLNEALVHNDFIGVVDGSANANAAMAVLAFRFEPAIGAAIGELWRQPISSAAVWECAAPEKRERWTTNPSNADQIIPIDPFFWAGESTSGSGLSVGAEVGERFVEFIAS